MNAEVETKIVTKANRNITFDLLRGYFLVAILINHFHRFPSIFDYFTARGVLWVNAAPGFVFVSGLLLGIVYKKKIQKVGLKNTVKLMLARGFKLYLIGSFFTLFYTFVALKIGNWQFINYGILQADFWEVLYKTLIFNYAYGWADLLLFYSVMLIFVAPVTFYLLNKNKLKILLILSFFVWLAVFIYQKDFRLTGSHLRVESWQFLFVLAMTFGYYKEKFAHLYKKYFHSGNTKFVAVFLILFFVTLLLSIADKFYGVFSGDFKLFLDRIFLKRELGPGLLILFLTWFVAFYYFFQKFQNLILKCFGWIFLPFGKNSLLTYSVQAVFLFFQFYVPFRVGFWGNTFATTILILLVWLTVKLLLFIQDKFFKTNLAK